jgi:hypothetical protein
MSLEIATKIMKAFYSYAKNPSFFQNFLLFFNMPEIQGINRSNIKKPQSFARFCVCRITNPDNKRGELQIRLYGKYLDFI